MKGIVLLNAYTKSAGANRQASRIAEELNALGVQTEMRLNGAFDADIFSSRVRLAQKPDFVVYLDKDKYLSRLWEKEGVRLFNSADGVEVCDDKMLTYIALANGGVEIPDTLPAPLCYYPDARVREEYCRVVEERLAIPSSLKRVSARGGWTSTSYKILRNLQRSRRNINFFPTCIRNISPQSAGKIRAFSSSAARPSQPCAAATTAISVPTSNSAGAAIPPRSQSRTAKFPKGRRRLLSLDYCGIDLLEGEDGRPIVCEVNSNAFFNEAEKVTGVNIAGAYAAHIAREMKKN